ncbi:hypothetical protein HY950_03770 [Candidatus Gottesmanbacteria bacterium]|nr:hypothetical protein [Candidatus Gottesmanbacteria bacterium]
MYITVHCTHENDRLAEQVAQKLATLVSDRAKTIVTADVVKANWRFVAAPKDVPANQNIIVAIFHHGGLLLKDDDVQHIGRQITTEFGDWQLLFTSDVTRQWFANGVAV